MPSAGPAVGAFHFAIIHFFDDWADWRFHMEMRWATPKLVDAAIVVAACLVLALFRLHAFDLPLETDEANYAYVGARLLEGDRLYIDAWDHQPPGVFMLFAAAIRVFGDAPLVFRWMATAFSMATLVLVFAILRRVSGRPAAILGVILFSVVSSDPGTGGEGANREIYMNTLVLAAWWLGLRGWANICTVAPLHRRDGTLPHFFSGPCSPGQRVISTIAAGAALGLASLLKTNAAVYWPFLAVWTAFRAWKFEPHGRMSRTAIAVASLAAGPALIWAMTYGYFASTGRASEFVEAVFLVNLDYAATGDSFWSRFWVFFDPPRFSHIFDSAFPLWIGAAAALAWMLSSSIIHRDPAMILSASFLLAAFVAVCLPGRFWPHYYYLLIPPAVIVFSLFVVALLHASAQLMSRRKRTAAVSIVASGLIVAVLLAGQYNHYISVDGINITLNRYNTRDYWGMAQASNVAQVTDPQDSVFVYGSDAAIYYYSKRRCGSRYTMITGLYPGLRGAEQRRQLLIEDLRASRPRVILVLLDLDPFPEWIDFLAEHYGPAVAYDVHDLTGRQIMFVFDRDDNPIRPIDWNWDRSEAGPDASSKH